MKLTSGRVAASAPAPAQAPVSVSALAFFWLIPLLCGIALFSPIDHDEGQYVSAVALMRSGLPFRDFPFLQTPLQPLLFAPLAWLCEGWLFPALRLVNLLCASVAAGLLCWTAGRAGLSRRDRAITALSFCSCHAFLFVATVARNDALPLLLHMAGLAALIGGLDRQGAVRAGAALAAGVLLGGAASAKISYGLPAAAVGLFALMHGGRLGWRALLALALGGVLGGVPTLTLFAIAPDAAWFGIIDYSLKAPMEWHSLNGQLSMVQWPLSLARMLRFLAQGMALVALVAVVRTWLPARRQRVHRLASDMRHQLICRLLNYVIVAGLIAAWLPRPIYAQYLVPLLPALFLRFGLMLHERPWRRQRLLPVLLGLFLIVGWAQLLADAIPNMLSGNSPPVSAMRDAHAIGAIVRASGKTGLIVTLSPEHVVDSGLRLDPRFAPGPFLFRTRHLLSPAERTAFHVVTMVSVTEDLNRHPPAALWVGMETRSFPAAPHGLDAPLSEWAMRHGYRVMAFSSGHGRLWIAP